MECDGEGVPRAFLCPITQEVFEDPVLAEDGFTYERTAIAEWLRSGSELSPMTGARLDSKVLLPNHVLRSQVCEWREATRDGR